MKWWRGVRKRHQRMTLRQLEGTSAVRHQCKDTQSWQVLFWFETSVRYGDRQFS